MEKWEYKIHNARTNDFTDLSSAKRIEAALNTWGQDGWELVCYAGTDKGVIDAFVFKRRLQS